jgi:3-phytase
MKIIDDGGIEVFRNEDQRSPMGIAMYTRPSDHAVFAIVSRKTGGMESYLEQYQLKVNDKGVVSAELIRRFGKFSGKKEIESVAVDNELGYVYYSDELYAIRKYYADPSKGNEELAVFGQGEYKEDCEGISVYKFDDGTGYLLVSDQSANTFNVYRREGDGGSIHKHTRIASIPMSTNFSDGSDVISEKLPGFKGGLFVAMSDDATFQFYSFKDMARKAGLRIRKR